jgi:tRNA pseudouridine65 synthase
VLDIVYQDDFIVVINKPSGLLVHKSKMAAGVKEFALQLLRDQLGQRVYPVHRLDRPTSGLLVFALDEQTCSQLSAQFASNSVKKGYQCVVRGYCQNHGEIDHPLKDPVDDRRLLRQGVTHEAKEAKSSYQTLARFELPWAVGRYPKARYSLVKVWPESGRRHQIRKHMDCIAHPIVGDTRYGQGTHNRLFREHLDSHRLLLAATDVCFRHPKTQRALYLEIPVAKEMRAVVQYLRNFPAAY